MATTKAKLKKPEPIAVEPNLDATNVCTFSQEEENYIRTTADGHLSVWRRSRFRLRHRNVCSIEKSSVAARH